MVPLPPRLVVATRSCASGSGLPRIDRAATHTGKSHAVHSHVTIVAGVIRTGSTCASFWRTAMSQHITARLARGVGRGGWQRARLVATDREGSRERGGQGRLGGLGTWAWQHDPCKELNIRGAPCIRNACQAIPSCWPTSADRHGERRAWLTGWLPTTDCRVNVAPGVLGLNSCEAPLICEWGPNGSLSRNPGEVAL